MKNISKAICAVMAEIKGIEKNSSVGAGKFAYKGVKDIDVKRTLLPLMQKNGLSVLPTQIDQKCENETYQDSYGKMKSRVFVEVNAKYLLLHTSGESIEISGYGHGVDTADKAAGKATTYALKYALLYTFMVPVGEIDDSDATHSNDAPKPQPKAKEAPKQEIKAIADNQVPAIVKWAKDKKLNVEGIQKYYKLGASQKAAIAADLNEL